MRGPSCGSRAITDQALAAISQLDAFPLGTLTAQDVKDVPFIQAAIETFSMLNVLGLAAALLVIGVLVVYLQARQRARTVSNVLSMRMGMRDRQAGAALVLELAAMLLVAFVLGASLGMVAGRLVSPLLDPLQTIPPAPLFDAPLAVVGWTLVGLALVARRRRMARAPARVLVSTWGRCSALPNEPVPARCVDLVKTYRTPTGAVHALRGVTLTFPARRADRGRRAVGEREVLAPARADRHRPGDVRRRVGRGAERRPDLLPRAPPAPPRSWSATCSSGPSDNFLPNLTIGEHLRLASGRSGGGGRCRDPRTARHRPPHRPPAG